MWKWIQFDYRAIDIYCEPLWLNHGSHLSGWRFVELFEVFWGGSLPDDSCYILDFFSSLHEDLMLKRDSSNHRKIGDINEALRICKQSTQTACIYLNAFRSNLINSEMISFEDCVEMAKVKLNNFIQSQITFERIKLERCGLRRSLANLKGFNLVTNFLKIRLV